MSNLSFELPRFGFLLQGYVSFMTIFIFWIVKIQDTRIMRVAQLCLHFSTVHSDIQNRLQTTDLYLGTQDIDALNMKGPHQPLRRGPAPLQASLDLVTALISNSFREGLTALPLYLAPALERTLASTALSAGGVVIIYLGR